MADLSRTQGEFSAKVDWMTPTDRGIVFSKDSLAYGPEMWTSDGTARGTKLLKDIVPGSRGSRPEMPVAAGGRVFFRAMQADGTQELWVTDGMEEGTERVMAFPTGGGSLFPIAGTDAGGFFTYERWDSDVPVELWFSGGGAEAPVLLNPLNEAGTSRAIEDPYAAVSAGAWCYFIANEDEVWRSDGTVAGTVKLADAPVVMQGWNPILAVAGGRVYVTANPVEFPAEIWSCTLDGQDARTILPETPLTAWQVRRMVGAGDRVYLVAQDNEDTRTLWTSDGTQAGTRSIALVHAGITDYQPLDGGVEWGGRFYFPAWSVSQGDGLWSTDGTQAGTRLVKDTMRGFGGSVFNLRAGGDFLYFQVQGARNLWEQWRTDGTTKGTRRVARLLDWNPYVTGDQVAVSQGALYFASSRNLPGNVLLRTRPGARAGVLQLTKPEKSTASSYAENQMEGTPYGMASGNFLSFVKVPRGKGYEMWQIGARGAAKAVWKSPSVIGNDDSLAFRGTLGANAVFTVKSAETQEVWATNGSARGTRMLARHDAGENPGYPLQFVLSGGKFFYSVMSLQNPWTSSLWVTDGTPAGTVRVMAGAGGVPAPAPTHMVDFKGALYFIGHAPGSQGALWKSDGTAAGTEMVKDIWVDMGSGYPAGLAVIGERLSITVKLPLTDQLWTSDGTAAGSVPVQVNYNIATALREIGESFDLDGLQLIMGRGTTVNDTHQWWRSDGTDAGTGRVVPDVDWQHLEYGDVDAVVAGGKLFYAGIDSSEHGDDLEPWVTDGTAAGTHRLKDIWPGDIASFPGNFVAHGDTVYFTAYDPAHGMELWKSDGTEAGTVLVADVEPGGESSFPMDLKVLNNKLYFHAERKAIGRELYVVE